jgi:hypothetical protein
LLSLWGVLVVPVWRDDEFDEAGKDDGVESDLGLLGPPERREVGEGKQGVAVPV